MSRLKLGALVLALVAGNIVGWNWLQQEKAAEAAAIPMPMESIALPQGYWQHIPDIEPAIARDISGATIIGVAEYEDSESAAVVHRVGGDYYRIFVNGGAVYYARWQRR